ncbi:hypothetical protein ACI513_00950 [Chryseobacterium sp. M5]|uniref:hypothetical protein n=1 Tax=Chryseobacterium sp. M5 TaxID=3379128 RepID=UPI0038574A27
MKKIILGLFITIGSTSCLFANEKKADNVVQNEKESESCQIVTHVTVLDTEGKTIANYDVCTEGSDNQCKNAVNGQVFLQKTIRVIGVAP